MRQLCFLCRFWLLDGSCWSVALPDDICTSWCCQDYATARRWWTASNGSSETLGVPEHSQPTMDKLTGYRRVHQGTGSRPFPADNPKQDRFIVFVSRRSHMSTARALDINFRCAAEVHQPDQTVRNRLNDECTRARRPARSQVLTEEHCAVRINFAREHQNRHLCHWRWQHFYCFN